MRQRSGIGAHEHIVLSVLAKTRQPMSAYEILNALQGSSIRAATQVYRSLDRLIRQGRVHRIASLNAYVMCASPVHDDPPGFFVCKLCGTVTEFDLPLVAGPLRDMGSGYEIDTINIELGGTCRLCCARRGAA